MTSQKHLERHSAWIVASWRKCPLRPTRVIAVFVSAFAETCVNCPFSACLRSLWPLAMTHAGLRSRRALRQQPSNGSSPGNRIRRTPAVGSMTKAKTPPEDAEKPRKAILVNQSRDDFVRLACAWDKLLIPIMKHSCSGHNVQSMRLRDLTAH